MALSAKRAVEVLRVFVVGAAVGLMLSGCSDDITYYNLADATVDSTVDTVVVPTPDSGTDTALPTPDSGTDTALPTADSGGLDAAAVVGNAYNGGLVWNSYWELRATGSGSLPTGVISSMKDFVRCQSCHGWDALGGSGGYVRRTSNATRPAPSAGSDLAAKFATATTTDVFNAGGRAFSTFDDTHPDFSLPGGLTAQQAADVVAFLKTGPKVQDVATLNTTPTPVTYTFTGADTGAGQTLFGSNCATCHGADGQTVAGAILGSYFSGDGRYSEGFHKMIYGDATGAMTRTAQGNLTAAQARDILAYIQANIPGTFPQN